MKNPLLTLRWLIALPLLYGVSIARAQESNGLAPEVTDLNAEDVSYALEANLPDLKNAFVRTTPGDRNDGIPVGELGVDGGKTAPILKFAQEIAAGDHGDTDSLLLFQNGKLLFESYYRRGRVNYPHYQMSITKSYTAMALGRAIQLGYFWWRHDMEMGDQKLDCKSGRGAGGQFILLFPELNLIAVITSHNKGMGTMLKAFPERVLPAFVE